MKKLFVALCLGMAPLLVLAWGQEGHSIVAEIAQRQVSDATRNKISKIAGAGVSLASLSNWADSVAHSSMPESYGWHFVDIPLTEATYDHDRDCFYEDKKSQTKIPGACVGDAIVNQVKVLSDSSAPIAKQREALQFIVHFVGDVHQPLHTVLDNIGENGVKVKFFNGPDRKTQSITNLHSVWDTGLLHASFYSWDSALEAILQNGDVAWQDPCALSGDLPTQVACWINESHNIARTPGLVVEDGAVLGDAYLDQFSKVRDKQLLHAGRRLGVILETVLGK